MIRHLDIASPELHRLLKSGALTFAGNRTLKIYGLLTCGSGKRMKKENRVFFANEHEAKRAGYRPCGNCMRRRSTT
jgi:methylphosphotriester-DNA--protein-cysteine methyltransferase